MSQFRKTKKKLSASALILIIACIIIAIPIVVFLMIIISASINTGKPILGDRFANDLNPSISEGQMKSITKEIKSFSEVEDCEIVMTTAQLRVNVDTSDSISKEEADALCDKIYESIDATLPTNTYFTMSSDGEKMYDLAINVYNYIPTSNEDPNWISYLVTKNSKMEAYEKQLVSEPLNPELAKELKGETTSEGDGEANDEAPATN